MIKNTMRRFLLFLILFCGSHTIMAQESWSDSEPKIMTLIEGSCPLKIKGKSGEWANFKNALPPGKKVIGAINPRRPDIIFFQLQRDAKFVFAGPRTCFEGEEDWNVRTQEEVQGYKSAPDSIRNLRVGMAYLRFAGSLKSTSTAEDLTLKYFPINIGIQWLDRKGESSWYLGGGVSAGFGRGDGEAVRASLNWETERKWGYHGLAEGSAYYQFKKMPLAIGFDLFAGLIKNSYSSNILNTTVSPTFAFIWGLSLGATVTMKEWSLSPKIYAPAFNPSLLGYGLSVDLQF